MFNTHSRQPGCQPIFRIDIQEANRENGVKQAKPLIKQEKKFIVKEFEFKIGPSQRSPSNDLSYKKTLDLPKSPPQVRHVIEVPSRTSKSIGTQRSAKSKKSVHMAQVDMAAGT